MSRFCVDTSAYAHFRRADRPVVELIDAADWIGMPSIVLGELCVGSLSGRHTQQNRVELSDSLANPIVEALVFDHDVARAYADILVSLRKAGTAAPANGIWVAASAARFGATVLTYDRHFNSIFRVGSLILES